MNTNRRSLTPRLGLLGTLAFAGALGARAQLAALAPQHAPPAPLEHRGLENEGTDQLLHSYEQQIQFVENKGQFAAPVLAKADFPLGQAIATADGMVVKTYDPASVAARADEGIRIEQEIHDGKAPRPLTAHLRGHAWLMDFVGRSASMHLETRDAHNDLNNYFTGNGGGKLVSGVRSFQEVWYKEVYARTDVRYYPAADGTLEYDIICHPGSDPSAIAIRLKGIDRLKVNDKGELVITTSVGEVTYPAPVVYQVVDGKQQDVKARYVVSGNTVKFALGRYNTALALVIDPIALRWATWVNTASTGDNHGHCIWVDPNDGAIYVVARVVGTTDQITVGAFDESANGNLEMVVGKYTEPATVGQSGSRVWQTYIGGNGDDNPYAMEQGPDGNLYITGYTSSTNYPLLAGTGFTGNNSLDQRSATANNIFITKINPAGTGIKSCVVGGNGDDGSFDIRLTAAGDVIVCGNTASTNLATLYSGSGASNTNNGGTDAVVFKVDQDLSTMVWMKNYGGSGTDQPTIMLQDNASGDIYVGGYTTSTNFTPLTSARQSTRGGSQAGFLQRLTSTGGVTWSSYFQAASSQSASILCMEFNDAKDQIYFGGVTTGLAASNISSSGVYDSSTNGSNDFYVCRMGTDQTFVGATYVGGSSSEVNMMGLNTDQNNDVFVFGYTNSTNFPVTSAPNTPLQTTNQGNNDKVFLKLKSDLSSLLFSTYYGGTQDDYDPVGERGIKFSNCRIYTIVTARSTNLPLTQGALNTTKNSGTGIYEPGLVVWANPPDLLGNSITGNQSVCAGSVPSDISGSVPAYVLPTISRNGATSTYPAIGSAASYQWQISTDSLVWSDIPGATSQNLAGSLIGVVNAKTFIRRVIGGDACILAGAADQVVTVKLISVQATPQNVSCFGLADGTLTATCDGVAPFSFNWSNGQTGAVASGLAAGSYSVTVTDANGCTAQGTFQVTQPDVLGVTTQTTLATCGQGNGSATANPIGGSSPYTYAWSEGTTAQQANSLSAGSYSVTVTDAHGCTAQADAQVAGTNAPDANAGDDAVIDCNTGNIIQLHGSSSVQGVSFSWTGPGGFTSGSQDPNVSTAGTYVLTVTNMQSGCSSTDQVSVTKNTTPPNANAGDDATLSCAMESVQLNGSSTTNGATFSWSGPGGFSSTDASVTVMNAGTYTLTVTDPANGCSAQDQASVGMDNAAPNASAQGGMLSCSTTSVMLNGGSTTQGASFSWSGPNGFTSADEDPTVSEAGTYVLTVTGPNGCTAMAEANVGLNNDAPNATAQGGVLNCLHQSVMLNGGSTTQGATFSWSGPSGFTSSDEDPTVSEAGTYVLTVMGPNGCTAMAQADVTLDRTQPDATAEGGLLNCLNGTVMLNGGSTTQGVSFSWTGPNSFTSSMEDPSVSAAGTYTLTVTAANGCTNTAEALVTMDRAQPNATATGGVLNCLSEVLMLNGGSTTQGATFSWTGPNGFTSNEEDPTISDAGTYVLTVTGPNGCTMQAEADVTLDRTAPNASAQGGTLTCATTSVMLNGGSTTQGATFSWSGPNGFTSSDEDPMVSEAGTYVLTVTGPNGCTAMAEANVGTNNELPNVSAEGGVLNCLHQTVTLNGGSTTQGATFSWSGPSGFASSDEDPVVSEEGTYVLTVTNVNGCSAQASAQVTLDRTQPEANATGGVLNCNHTSVMLMGTGNGTYAWSGPGNFSSTEQNPTVTMAGNYTLVVTGTNGCTKEATAEVTLDNTVPGAQAQGGTLTCGQESVMLMGSGNGSFAWSGPGNFSSTEQNPSVSMAGTYTLVVTGTNGCTSQASADVELDNGVPGAEAHGGTITCGQESVMLMGGGNGSFAWSGPGNFSSTEQNPTVSMAGTYTLVVTGTNGCTSQASADVELDNGVPGAEAHGGTITCGQESVMLMGSGNGSFAWSGPGNFSSTEQNPTVTMAGTYTLVVTGTNGCTSQATAHVELNNTLPGAEAHGGTITCGQESVMLMGSGNGSFAWSGPGNFSSTEQNPTVTMAGTYTLVVTGTNGCTSQATAEVVRNSDVPTASAEGGLLTCAHTSVMLNGGSTTQGASFAWSGPGNFSSGLEDPIVTEPGLYTLVVTGPNGCTAQANANVGLNNEVPNVSAEGTTLTCASWTEMLNGGSATPGVSFHWSGPNGFSSNDEDPSVSDGGMYTLTVTAANGCTASANAEVLVDRAQPEITAHGGVIDCNNVPATLSVTYPQGTSPMWTGPNGFVSAAPDPQVTEVGVYQVVVTGANGCSAVAEAVVTHADCGGCKEPLILECAPDVKVQCGMPLEPAVIGEPNIRKNKSCPTAVFFTYNDVYSGVCPLILTRTWTIGDDAGNYETCVQTITIEDLTEPTLHNIPADVTVQCGQMPPKADDVKAEDNCTSYVPITFDERTIPGDCPGSYTVERVWTATDGCGNIAQGVQTITVVDDQAPVIMCDIPADVKADCKSIPEPVKCKALDDCAGEVDVTVTDESSTKDCSKGGVIVRTYSATDGCGNTATVVQTIHLGGVFDLNEAWKKNAPQVKADPNPFRDMCTIRFTAVKSGSATLEIADGQGRTISKPFSGQVVAGQEYTIRLTASEYGTGMYIYRLVNGEQEAHGRLIIE